MQVLRRPSELARLYVQVKIVGRTATSQNGTSGPLRIIHIFGIHQGGALPGEGSGQYGLPALCEKRFNRSCIWAIANRFSQPLFFPDSQIFFLV